MLDKEIRNLIIDGFIEQYITLKPVQRYFSGIDFFERFNSSNDRERRKKFGIPGEYFISVRLHAGYPRELVNFPRVYASKAGDYPVEITPILRHKDRVK